MEHIVKSGDTLGLIARANGTTVATLMRLNPAIENANLIFPGQQIKLPDHPAARQTREVGQIADCSECADEIVDLAHQADERIFIPLTATQQKEFEQEEARMEQLIRQFYAGLDAAEKEIVDHKTAFVKLLEQERVIDPQKPSEPMRLTEVRRVAGQRHYAYVRKDSGWRRHRSWSINSQDRARSQGWFDANTGKVNPAKLRDQLAKDLRNPKLNINISQHFVDWCLLEWQSKPRHWTPVEGAPPIVVGAEAQAMRFAVGASLSTGYDPKTMNAHVAAKASASVSLVEAKATATTVWPAEDACEWTIRYRDEGKQLQTQSLGKFRTKAQAELAGFAGASALLAANVHVDMQEGVPKLRGAGGTSAAMRRTNSGGPASAEASAFAGVRADGKLEGSIEWMDTLEQTPKWAALCKLGVGAGAALGLGAEAMVKLRWSPRELKFFFNVHAGLVAGVGASGEVGAEVDAGEFITMVHCVYNGLLRVDFRHLEDIDPETFKHLSQVMLYGLLMGLSITTAGAEAAGSSVTYLQVAVRDYVQAHRNEIDRERLAITTARNLMTDLEQGSKSLVLHAPPEVKGPLLDILCFDYGPSFWNKYTAGFNLRERAILRILTLSQSWRDYQETVSRMNQTGHKTSFAANRKRLTDLMRAFPALQIDAIETRLRRTVAVADQPVQIARHFSFSGTRYA